MKFWKKWFKRSEEYKPIEELIEEELTAEEDSYVVSRDQVDMKSSSDRQRYIESLLEQIADAQKQLDTYKAEYNTVNRYLQDMEDLELIAGEDKESLQEHARAIHMLELDKNKYEEKKQKNLVGWPSDSSWYECRIPW